MEDLLIDFDFFCHGVWNGQYWAERGVFKNGTRLRESSAGGVRARKSFRRNSALQYEFALKVSV